MTLALEWRGYHATGWAVYAERSGRRAFVVDHSTGAVTEFDIGTDVFGVDLSHDGRRLLSTHWHREGIDVWDVATGAHTARVDVPRKCGAIVADRTGRRAAVLGRKGFFLVDLDTGEEQPIANCNEDLQFASFSARTNRLLVAMRRKGKLCEIRFDELDAREIELPIAAAIRWVGHSPTAGRFAVLDGKKSLHTFDELVHEPIWSTSLRKVVHRDHLGVACLCGDGTLIGGCIARSNRNDLVTLDAESGEVVDVHEGANPAYGFPGPGTVVLSKYLAAMTLDGVGDVTGTDLATGESAAIRLP